MLGLSSLYGTSTVSLTLVASTDSTALFTSVVSNCSGGCAGVPAAGLGSASHALTSRRSWPAPPSPAARAGTTDRSRNGVDGTPRLRSPAKDGRPPLAGRRD